MNAIAGEGEEERRGERDLERTEDHERGYSAGTRDRKKGYNMVDGEVEIAENAEVKLAKKWR